MKPSQLSEIETGGQYPTEEKLRLIAKQLVVDYEEIKKYEVRIDKEFRDLVRKDPEVGLLLRRVRDNPKLAGEFNRNYGKVSGDQDAGKKR
jgi:transcriptional regulator with XRE-family HTH domain